MNRFENIQSQKGGKNIMDILKKITLASIGAVDLTCEKAEQMLDELVKRGEMTSDERAEAIKNFVNKSIDSTEKLRQHTEELFERFSGRFSSKFNEQISQLANRIEQLNVRLSELENRQNKRDSNS
jgi:polyhydroxyalkanoate synthesis regulator phasin